MAVPHLGPDVFVEVEYLVVVRQAEDVMDELGQPPLLLSGFKRQRRFPPVYLSAVTEQCVLQQTGGQILGALIAQCRGFAAGGALQGRIHGVHGGAVHGFKIDH